MTLSSLRYNNPNHYEKV